MRNTCWRFLSRNNTFTSSQIRSSSTTTAIAPHHHKLSTALGSVYGALIGDAAGAVLEFPAAPYLHMWKLNKEHQRVPTPPLVELAMTLPGGGHFNIAPAQITDDGELTICLLRALAASGRKWNQNEVAQSYVNWFYSNPFDIGGTTKTAIETGISFYSDKKLDRARGVSGEDAVKMEIGPAMASAAAQHCMRSKANGSLMRSTPLGIWGHKLVQHQLCSLAIYDSSLTHPNPVCTTSVFAYSAAIAYLMNHNHHTPDDRKAVNILAAKAFAYAYDAVKTSICEGKADVLAWLKEAEQGHLPSYTSSVGFVRIAFTYAFCHLLRTTSFQDAMRETLLGGGDTDTNACVVGGLLGALHGVEGLPKEMLEKVKTCDYSKGSNPRPDELHPKHVDMLVQKIVQDAPDGLES